MELEESINFLNNMQKSIKENQILFNEPITVVLNEENTGLAIKTVLQELENSIPKKKIEDKHNKFKRQYEDELEKNSIKAFILKCQIEILQELLEDK